ncbi:hypothetical protein CCACVL1_07059 [Corchorus capsularis]|uniref:Uncharacterized protein n=1 Tax=Corchorus capsularis TaxID=210143 RepID=A0A1R3JA08_COCAP|nr:hypothetical protein CCACVL1_07059 [Corchorus capsularis]
MARVRGEDFPCIRLYVITKAYVSILRRNGYQPVSHRFYTVAC